MCENFTFSFTTVGSDVFDVKTMNRELNLQNCTVVQLRNVLRSLGLSTKGRKAELVSFKGTNDQILTVLCLHA